MKTIFNQVFFYKYFILIFFSLFFCQACTSEYYQWYNSLSAGWKQVLLDEFEIDGYSSDEEFKRMINTSTLRISVQHQIDDLSPVKNFKKLKRLSISRNRIEDYSNLSSLSNLESLTIYGNPIKTLESLGELSNLKELILGDCPLKEFGDLSRLSSLEYLSITKLPSVTNTLSDISKLSPLLNLRKLVINASPRLKSLSKFPQLPLLEELTLTNNQFENIAGIGNLKSLKKLSLAKSNLRDISFIRKLTGLEMLRLNENKINNLKSLKNLKNLKVCYLSKNPFSDVTPLRDLKDLHYLDISYSNITSIKSLSELNKIKTLILQHSLLTSLKGVENMQELEDLWIRYTNISNLEPLLGLEKYIKRNGWRSKRMPKEDLILLYKRYCKETNISQEYFLNFFDRLKEGGKK